MTSKISTTIELLHGITVLTHSQWDLTNSQHSLYIDIKKVHLTTKFTTKLIPNEHSKVQQAVEIKILFMFFS